MALIQTAQIAEWLDWDQDKLTERQADLTRITNASEACVRRICGRDFQLVENETREFDLPEAGRLVPCGDILTASRVEARSWAGGVFEVLPASAWRLDRTRSDFPYQSLTRIDGKRFRPGLSMVKITGDWGWREVPSSIEQAALMLAANYLARAQSPKRTGTGIEGTDVDLGGFLDMDIMGLLDDYKTGHRRIA